MKKIAAHLLFFAARIYWFMFRPKEYGAKAVIKKGDEILYIKQGWGGAYTFPGGRINKNEVPEDTVKREVKEEVGIELKTVTYLGAFISRAFYKYDTVFAYFAEVPEDTNTTIDGFEVIEAIWRSEDDTPSLGWVADEVMDLYHTHAPPQNI